MSFKLSLAGMGLGLLVSCMVSTVATPVQADVHFGKGVRIGGHDVSNQTFTPRRRGLFYVYKSTPPRPGCVWRTNRDGSKTKVCHFREKR